MLRAWSVDSTQPEHERMQDQREGAGSAIHRHRETLKTRLQCCKIPNKRPALQTAERLTSETAFGAWRLAMVGLGRKGELRESGQ